MKNELQDIFSGKKQVSCGSLIQTTLDYLRRSQETSALVKTDKCFKEEETKVLSRFVTENKLWIHDLDSSQYISEGAEQKVYLKDGNHVWKLNDAIYYQSWQDYLVNLLFNNYFFFDTAYQLKGFYEENKIIYAVVVQDFVKANEKTNLEEVKIFMANNGFVNTRNNDYFNPELNLILEDLHDENVLTRNGLLYFIDTVFYIKE